jgi:protein NrfD
MDPEIVYSVQSGYYWDWKVALDLFFGGAGVGAFVFAVCLHEFWGRKYRRIPQTAAFLAPILVGAGLLLLMIKLGRPHYIFETFVNFAPTAPLWWGGVFQTLFLVGAVWYAFLWLNDEPRPMKRGLGLALVPVAVIVAAYHGMLLAVLPSRPLWNTGPTVLASLVCFATTGIAAVMAAHLLRMKWAGRLDDAEHVETFLDDLWPVRYVLAVALLLQLAFFFFWWIGLRFGDLADREALAAANTEYGLLYWGLGIGLGIGLPLVLGTVSLLYGDRPNESSPAGEPLDGARPGSTPHGRLGLGATLIVPLAFLVFLWWLSADSAVANGSRPPGGSVTYWTVGLLAGVGLPLAIGAHWWRKGDARHQGLHVWTVGVASVLILVGGLFFRLAVVLSGQLNPVFTTLP